MSFNALLRYEDVFDPKSGSILKANGHRGGFNVEPIRGNVLTKVEERSELRRRCGSSSRLVPQNASDPGYPRIALHLERESVRVAHRAELVELALGRGPHRAELPHREGSPADADPPLAEERTAGRIETNREHAHREERGRKEQQDDTGAEIEGALDQSGRRVQLHPFQRNDRAVPDGCTRSRDARYSSRPGATSTRAGHARTYIAGAEDASTRGRVRGERLPIADQHQCRRRDLLLDGAERVEQEGGVGPEHAEMSHDRTDPRSDPERARACSRSTGAIRSVSAPTTTRIVRSLRCP